MTPHLAFPSVDFRSLAGEVEREAGQRERFYPERVAKGRMLQADADRELALAHAWLEDVARLRRCWQDQPGSAPAPPAHRVPWLARRDGLLRELKLRERVYPNWIAGGRMSEGEARQRTACLACLLAIYEDGWDWRGSDGLTPHHSATAEREFYAVVTEARARYALQAELPIE